MELQPMEGVHNWKQFLVHMAIVVLGVCIAIGLDQTVEWAHHVHQRHEFEAELREEGLANQKIVESDLKWFDVHLEWLLEVKGYVDGHLGGHGDAHEPFPAEPRADSLGESGTVGDNDPKLAVWTTGKDSGLVELLPRDVAEQYATVYSIAALEIEQDHVSLLGTDDLLAMVVGDQRRPRVTDVSGMSDEQMRALSQAVARNFVAWDTQRRYLLLFYGENNAMLDGQRTDAAINAEVMKAFRRYPSRFAGR